MGWAPVPAARLGLSPYRQICEIVPLVSGKPQGSATGWLVAPGKVATAGHVLYNGYFKADACRLRWANSPPNNFIHITADSFRRNPSFRPARQGSSDDRAIILVPDGPSQPLPIHNGPLPAQIAVIGFQEAVLVESPGRPLSVPPYLGHNAAADQGHSGAPVLAGGAVAGMHIGNGGKAREFLTGSEYTKFISKNAALLIKSSSFFNF